MPGILPMKVIKIGSNAQSRIAQACDRCRSKKIRCDGIRPSCTQCLSVGFECKTSDKLSRRAFPRGYTESLEERVRALEAEVRELKDLLDEKDETIDMLSRIHPRPTLPAIRKRPKPHMPTPKSDSARSEDRDTVLNMTDAFRTRLEEHNRATTDFDLEAFSPPAEAAEARRCLTRPVDKSWQAPARIVSDQLVNIFFQEWAPLFPILHRPTFLALYATFVAFPNDMYDNTSLAQLNLVFAIAARSSNRYYAQDIDSFDDVWHAALDVISHDYGIPSLQSLLLAQLACILAGEYSKSSTYRGLAVSLSQHIGLDQVQKGSDDDILNVESRKRLFWSMYTLDCFTAAQMGIPRSLEDADIICELPANVDDEYLTDTGVAPMLSGEMTKMSSALALFKAARLLAKVLSECYPTSSAPRLSFRNLMSLSDELDAWQRDLPQHLRLQFKQDKPSTNVISSRSPLLSLTYHYIRCLIFQPAVCADSAPCHVSDSAKVSLADSAKHIVQILQLLTERSLAFTLCLNQKELWISAGFCLLLQGLDLVQGSKLRGENQRLMMIVANALNHWPSPASSEFRRICIAFAVQFSPPLTPPLCSNRARDDSNGSLEAQKDSMSSAQRHLRALVARISPGLKGIRPADRRASAPVMNNAICSRTSLSSVQSEPPTRPPVLTSQEGVQRSSMSPPRSSISPYDAFSRSTTNLDFMASAANPAVGSAPQGKGWKQPTSWENLLYSIEAGDVNLFNPIFGDSCLSMPCEVPSHLQSADAHLACNSDVWTVSHGGSLAPSRSVLSFSDDSLTSVEEIPELNDGRGRESVPGVFGTEGPEGFVYPNLSAEFGL